MNNVSLIGRLTADPEVRDYQRRNADDLTVATFSLAVDRPGSEDADFIRIKSFGTLAQFAEKYFAKGQRIGVSGRIQTSRYEDNDGNTRYSTEVIADRFDFADSKREDESSNKSARNNGSKSNNGRRG